MAKRKYPSELNSRTVRINIGDWQWLNSLAQTLGTTVAEAFHKVVTELAPKAEPEPAASKSPAQIPMPVTMAMSTPVTTKLTPIAKKSTPVTITRRRSTPVSSSFSREVEVNDSGKNGHR